MRIRWVFNELIATIKSWWIDCGGVWLSPGIELSASVGSIRQISTTVPRGTPLPTPTVHSPLGGREGASFDVPHASTPIAAVTEQIARVDFEAFMSFPLRRSCIDGSRDDSGRHPRHVAPCVAGLPLIALRVSMMSNRVTLKSVKVGLAVTVANSSPSR